MTDCGPGRKKVSESPEKGGQVGNVDAAEAARFNELASGWWDPEGDSKPLHALNPARLRFIKERCHLPDTNVLDVGCGGGILAESLAQAGAKVTGIDVAENALRIARLHLHESGLAVDYQCATAEAYAEHHKKSAQVVTCLEMLEHVPDPASVIAACSEILKPGGQVFFSTLNRTPAAFALAILGAEHVARLLPVGTHRYERFIKPSELLAWARAAGLEPREVCGLHYNPLTGTTQLGGKVDVNYLVHASKPESA